MYRAARVRGQWARGVTLTLTLTLTPTLTLTAGSVRALLRLLRNTWHHADALSSASSDGARMPPREPDAFVDFWCTRFPGLLAVAR